MITQSSPASRTAPDSAAPLSLADAQALACRFAVPVAACDTVRLHDALDRVLAADVIAPFDIPAYDNSAMDGYAFDGSAYAPASAADIALTVAGTALAGHPFDGAVAPGACIRIMTGAPMPAGCDTVIAQEHVRVDGDVIRFAARDITRGANCRRAGEDLARGARALA
ncbi:molybdopterin molybdenumtransferase MoeA, partial [Burkholderia territorii]